MIYAKLICLKKIGLDVIRDLYVILSSRMID